MAEDSGLVRERTKQLGAWFLGPKAENAAFEEEMILYILRDYFHWRRNYYPSDEITITQQLRRESHEFCDALFQQLMEMLGRLKRHFPFYSPRYIGHMLSDQTIPSVLGYFAGMLYNPNNVTPEAAPVTVEWELQVAADILRLLGYQAPPTGGAQHRQTRQEFGWAHITGGGTVANFEALWVARNVRYFPLAVKRLAVSEDLALRVKLPGEGGHAARPIQAVDDRALLGIKPNEAVFLLPRLVEEVRQRWRLSRHEATARTWELLASTGFETGQNGAAAAYSAHPPVLLASGAAHYSLTKAADLLGIGRSNLIFVDVNRGFRADMRDLEEKINAVLDEGRLPLAVVAIAGTTEEGAVDPVHEIADLRARLEATRGQSFWLHIDAAWMGYLRAMFVPPGGDDAARRDGGGNVEESLRQVNEFAARRLEIRRGVYHRAVEMRWGSRDVVSAFLAFPRAESIVIDPHKMGYVPYPCGVAAFRNDRVRHFLAQEAPYLEDPGTADVARHGYQPPASVGPYILEGSKPGAAAAACWLSHRMIPPDRSGYGEILRASILAARELYERLAHWEQSCRANRESFACQFLPITALPPDTNIVCFVIQEKGNSSLARMNQLGEAVYQRFTIPPGGSHADYSYLQAFFLSRTRFQPPHYSPHSVEDLLQRAGVEAGDYPKLGVFVLRATVMSPYITLNAETGRKQCYLAEFMEELARVAGETAGRLQREA